MACNGEPPEYGSNEQDWVGAELLARVIPWLEVVEKRGRFNYLIPSDGAREFLRKRDVALMHR